MDYGLELPARITFGRFHLMPRRRELLRDGQPIRVGGRAFDVLLTLIEARGGVVSKDALMAHVWPVQVVEENNLELQISALRTAFGEERALIRTVYRRGYQFTGQLGFPAEDAQEKAGAMAAPEADAPTTNLPQPVSELIGRDDSLTEIVALATVQRLVTLTGAGGIGKTRLAVAAAHQLLPQFKDGAWLVELAALSDPGLVPGSVAAALGLELATGAVTAERVANAISGKQLLVLLDNCEHLIEAVAITAEALLRASPAARVIATSREPLGTEGEQVYLVPPLKVPAETDDSANPLEYGAVRLFVERARAAEPRFSPDGRLMATLAMICRRLDGIPLAIELAAARAAVLGVEEITVRLDECFNLLTGGRRTALPRHQTLRATLDWSYELLPEPQRVLLRRLAIFAGAFTLDAVSAVFVGRGPAPPGVIDGLPSLVAKSLIAAEAESGVARYRLLDTTRAYALAKLAESGERTEVAQRHAQYYLKVFERGEAERKVRATAEWLGAYSWQIDSLRAALDWAFSAAGDASIGIALTVAAVPLWMLLPSVDECRRRVEQALAALEPETNRDRRLEMRLHAAMGEALTYTRGATSEYEAAWTKALAMAESLADVEYQLLSLWGLWSFHLTRGRHRIALELAQRFCAVAKNSPDPNDRRFGERMIGAAMHHLGDQASARRHLEEGLTQRARDDHRPDTIRFQADFGVIARSFLARVLWFQGFPDQALRTAETTVAEAQTTGHALSFYLALAMAACPVALLVGDLVAADHYVERLLQHSQRHGLPLWSAYGRCYQGALVIRRGQIDTGIALLRAGFAQLGEAQSAVLRLVRLLSAEHLGRSGRIADGMTAIQEGIDHSERTEERWLNAELLRVEGELVLSQGADGAATAAADHFRQALDWARRHGALAWELRAATSFARLLSDQGRSGEAIVCLQPVYDRFTEGYHTTDLKSARELLDALR
jgi:predicted ATPase/DNA-binding winged helix-turn-helix (wHTH) protein